jgi:hypothetical protein
MDHVFAMTVRQAVHPPVLILVLLAAVPVLLVLLVAVPVLLVLLATVLVLLATTLLLLLGRKVGDESGGLARCRCLCLRVCSPDGCDSNRSRSKYCDDFLDYHGSVIATQSASKRIFPWSAADCRSAKDCPCQPSLRRPIEPPVAEVFRWSFYRQRFAKAE